MQTQIEKYNRGIQIPLEDLNSAEDAFYVYYQILDDSESKLTLRVRVKYPRKIHPKCMQFCIAQLLFYNRDAMRVLWIDQCSRIFL